MPLRLLLTTHVRGGDKVLLRGIMSGVVLNGFLLGQGRRGGGEGGVTGSSLRGEVVLCRFCGDPDGDGRLFLECSYLPSPPHSPPYGPNS